MNICSRPGNRCKFCSTATTLLTEEQHWLTSNSDYFGALLAIQRASLNTSSRVSCLTMRLFVSLTILMAASASAFRESLRSARKVSPDSHQSHMSSGPTPICRLCSTECIWRQGILTASWVCPQHWAPICRRQVWH